MSVRRRATWGNGRGMSGRARSDSAVMVGCCVREGGRQLKAMERGSTMFKREVV